MKQRRQMLTLRFANKCVNNRKTSKMFEKSLKIHKMKLRKTKTYKETNALTKRLQTSAIPTMEKMLNIQEAC